MPAGGMKTKGRPIGTKEGRKYYVNPGMQSRHIRNTETYNKYMKSRSKVGDVPTRLKGDAKFAQDLVDRYTGKGKLITKKDGSKREEFYNTSKIVGKYLDKKTNKWLKTRSFTIVYGKHGVHIYPMKKRNE